MFINEKTQKKKNSTLGFSAFGKITSGKWHTKKKTKNREWKKEKYSITIEANNLCVYVVFPDTFRCFFPISHCFYSFCALFLLFFLTFPTGWIIYTIFKAFILCFFRRLPVVKLCVGVFLCELYLWQWYLNLNRKNIYIFKNEATLLTIYKYSSDFP